MGKREKRKVKSVFLSHLESMGSEWTPAIREPKSFGRGKKIIRMKMKNRLAENGKSFGADFFVAFSKERGLSAGRGSLFPGVIVSYGKHIHPHHLFVDE